VKIRTKNQRKKIHHLVRIWCDFVCSVPGDTMTAFTHIGIKKHIYTNVQRPCMCTFFRDVCTDESPTHLMSDKSRRRTTEKRDEMARKVPSRLLYSSLDAFPTSTLDFYPEIAGRGIIMITLSDHSPSFIFITRLTTTTTAYGITARKTASAKSPKETNRKGKKGRKIGDAARRLCTGVLRRKANVFRTSYAGSRISRSD
jgi:hypothetical protein